MSGHTEAFPASAGLREAGGRRTVLVGVSGLLAVVLAILAAGYQPDLASTPVLQLHVARLTAFASLTIWLAFAFGIERSGIAAMASLAFASFLDLVLVPSRGPLFGTLASANLGIVVAYCGLQLCAWRAGARPAEGKVPA